MQHGNEHFRGIFRYARDASGIWRLRINWKLVGFVLAGTLAVIYFAAVAFLYCRERNTRKIEETRLSEMLAYPFSPEIRGSYNRRFSQKLIEASKQEKDPHEVLSLVLRGLRYDASNPDGRIFYSYVLFLQRRSRAALEFLRDGLNNAKALRHPEYVRFFARQCLKHFEDELLIEVADSLADSEKISSENRFALCASAAQSEIFRGKFAAAEARLNRAPLAGTASAEFLRAHIARARGDVSRAIRILESLNSRFRSPELNVEIARDCAALGEQEKAFRLLASAESAPNLSAKTHIQILDTLNTLRHPKAFTLYEQSRKTFLKKFGEDANALLEFCIANVRKKNSETVEFCRKTAENRAFPNYPDFILAHIETLLLCGKINEAGRELNEIFANPPVWLKANEGILCGLRAVVFYAQNNESLGDVFLNRAQNNLQLSVSQTVALSRALEACGNDEKALEILKTRYRVEAENPLLLEAILLFSIRKNDTRTFADYALRLTCSRRPSQKSLKQILKFAQSDRLFFYEKQEALLKSLRAFLDETNASAF